MRSGALSAIEVVAFGSNGHTCSNRGRRRPSRLGHSALLRILESILMVRDGNSVLIHMAIFG